MDNSEECSNKLSQEYLDEWIHRDLKAEMEECRGFYRECDFTKPKKNDYNLQEWLEHLNSEEYNNRFK